MAEVDERSKAAQIKALEQELARERRLKELADERASKMRQLAEERAAAVAPSPASVRAADERVTPTPAPTPAPVVSSPASVKAADTATTVKPTVTPTPTPTPEPVPTKSTTQGLKAAREEAVAARVEERAASNPLYNPTVRPQGGYAIVDGTEYIVYYGWVGGREDGEWKPFRAEATPENMQKYGARVFAGETKATFENIQGTTTLKNQPVKVTDAEGRPAFKVGSNVFTIDGFIDENYIPPKGSNIYQLFKGKLYYSGEVFNGTTPEGQKYVDGIAFTGTDGNNKYVNGILIATYNPDARQWSLTKEGKRFNVQIDPFSGQTISGEVPAGTTSTTAGVITGGTTTLPFTGTFATTTLPYTGGTTTKPLVTTMGTTPTTPTATPLPTGLEGVTAERRGIFDVLTDRFKRYGLESLVPRVRDLIINGATEDTITIQLQETPEYQRRFRANQERIRKGLSVLTPTEYLNAEDAYRQILRAYGLNQFDNDDYVSQFISNDISAAELSSRVVNAVQRVRNADPAVSKTLQDFYGIGQNDLVAYVLDPNQQLPKIERQIAAAEIGTAARRQGIETGVGVAEQLAAQGITQAEAQKGYATIADILLTAEKLSEIYKGVEEEYDLAQAEQEVFNTLASAQRRRQRLTQREFAAFSGQSGLGRTSLSQQSGGQF